MKDNGSKFIKANESFFETDAAKRWPDDRPWPGLKLPLDARLIKEDKRIEVKAHAPFSISDECKRYIFNRHEFWANIYNELFNDMQKNYRLHHKQLSWEEYVDTVALELKSVSLDYRRLFLGHEWMSDGCSPLFLDTLACIAYVKLDFFDEIMEKLKNRKDA